VLQCNLLRYLGCIGTVKYNIKGWVLAGRQVLSLVPGSAVFTCAIVYNAYLLKGCRIPCKDAVVITIPLLHIMVG